MVTDLIYIPLVLLLWSGSSLSLVSPVFLANTFLQLQPYTVA